MEDELLNNTHATSDSLTAGLIHTAPTPSQILHRIIPAERERMRQPNALSTSAIGALTVKADLGKLYCLFSPQGGTTMPGPGH